MAYNSTVIGVCALTSADVAVAWCRECSSGEFKLPFQQIVKKGAGGQLHKRKGTTDPTLSMTCVGVAKTDMARFWPTAAGAQVADIPNLLVTVTGGNQYKLYSCQPGPASFAISEDDEWEFTCEIKAKVALTSGKTTVYNSLLGHTTNDTKVSISGNGFGVMDASLANGLTAIMHNPMDGKTAGSRTQPDGYMIAGGGTPSLDVTTDDQHNKAEWLKDTNTKATVVLALTNGTSGEDITITCADWSQDEATPVPLQGEGKVLFPSTWTPDDGNTYGRVAFT